MAHIPTLVCGCGHEMLIQKNGVTLQANSGGHPYYKVSADAHECPNCFAKAYLPARQVLVVQHEERFDTVKHDAEFNLAN